MDKRILELAVEIVQAQATLSKMTGEEIESALIRVYNALFKMQEAEREGRAIEVAEERAYTESEPESELLQTIDPRASIREENVICMECGGEFKQLTANHLRTHGLSPREYKRKYGFPLKQPLAARSLTKSRSKSAKKRGLPPKLQQYLEDQRERKLRIGEAPEEERPSLRRTARKGAA